MNLQYLTNTNPPPAQSVLQYKVDPDTVFVSTATEQMYANLTITVFNPSSEAVTCQKFQFGFYVGAQYGDLTASATGIQTVSDQASWTISSQATENPDTPTLYQFSAPASGMANLQLAPQQSLVFHLNGILINEAVGEGGVPIVITEVTGTSGNPSVVSGEISISKEQPTLAAQLSVAPPTPITPGQQVTLNWEVTGSDHWQLYDFDTSTLLYDSEKGSPPNALSYGPVSPQQNTNYELIAFKGELFTTAYAEAMVVVPTVLTARGPGAPVDAGSQVVISWTSAHATTIKLEPGEQTADASSGEGSFTVTPTTDTTYNLTPSNENYEGAPLAVSVYINPPQITSFAPSQPTYAPGQPVTLSWATKSAVSATLEQSIAGQTGIINLGSVEVQSTGYTVHPTNISTYILTVEGQGQAIAQLVVINNPQSFQTGPQLPYPGTYPSALASDGTHVWVANSYANTVAMMNPGDGTLLRDIAVGQYPAALAFDGTHIWVANSTDGTVTVLNASDGSMAPFARNPIPVGTSPQALVYDGTHVWVANYNDETITVLNASDGSLASISQNPIHVGYILGMVFDGTYIWVTNSISGTVTVLNSTNGNLAGAPFTHNPVPVGNDAEAIAFDGTHIWIANPENSIVTVLNPSDGTMAGSPFAVNPIPVGETSAMAYDGTHIWLADSGANTITVLNAADGTQAMPTFTLGDYALAMLFDGTHIWVANSLNSTVTKI